MIGRDGKAGRRARLWGGAGALVALGALVGCGGGGANYRYADPRSAVEVSLRLPAGWAQEGPASDGMFSLKENPEMRGSIIVWPSEGKDLATWVETYHIGESKKMAAGGQVLGGAVERMAGARAGESVGEAFAWRLISRTPKKVGDLEAIELVEDLGGKRLISLSALKGDRVCEITFFCPPEQWAKNEAEIRASLEGVEIR